MEKKVRTIGVMVDWYRSQYQYEISQGIREQADKYGLNVLYFIGTYLKSYDELHQHYPTIYRMLNSRYLDYLIIFAGVVADQASAETIRFFKELKDLPVITLGFKMNQYPGIIVENKIGFKKMVSHLIKDHKRRKPAYLDGPIGSYDARERLAIYKEVLAENNIPLREELIVRNGLFTIESGIRGAEILQEDRKLVPGKDFNILIAANDNMAAGAARILLEHDVCIPREVSIGGFDNNDLGKYSDISLTTVNQPTKRIGREAVNYIMGNCKLSEDNTLVMPTNPVIRRSCGCSFSRIYFKDLSAPVAPSAARQAGGSNDKFLLQKKLENILSIYSGEAASDWLTEKFTDIFLGLLNHKDEDLFFNELENILSRFSKYDNELFKWHNVLCFLKSILGDMLSDKAAGPEFSCILDRGHTLVGIMIKKVEMKKQIAQEFYIERVRNFEEAMKSKLDLDQLFDLLADGFRQLELDTYYLFFFNDTLKEVSDLKLVLTCRNNKRDPDQCENSTYSDFNAIFRQFLAGKVPASYCILPLVEMDHRFGFIIFKKNDTWITRDIYERIATQLSSTLKSARLFSNIRNANSVLERTQAKLKLELEAARNIQTSLLPKKLFHPDFEMAARMQTAISVGGDYYDFIQTGGRHWVVIGDASGHGVHSGLIMMMVQTSIHLVLKQEPEISPRVLLTRINEIITENIRKLGDEKFMTILVMTYQGAGKFIYSGMHLPLLIYRSRTQKIEMIEYSGIWLGLVKDISEMNRDLIFTLQPGDCLLLYTDGVTEAKKMDPEFMIYGSQRLCEAFARVAGKPAGKIIDHIVADLAGYSFHDDITLFVIKRNQLG